MDHMLVKKANLAGEWYIQTTLLKKQTHNSLAFTGLTCPTDRIHFVINGEKLLGFRSYDKDREIYGRDQDTLVAAFNITAQTNDGIKVDWSQNLAPNIKCNQWLNSITMLNLNDHDDLIKIEDDYIESTTNAIVKPDLKMCKAVGQQHCHAAQFSVKTSFRKVNPNNTYEPLHYPQREVLYVGKNDQGPCLEGDDGCTNTKELWLHQDAMGIKMCDPLKHNVKNCFAPSISLNENFGYFTTYKQSYDRKEGFSRRGGKELINRHNLWLKNKVPKKIIYYLNANIKKELMPAIKRVEQAWDEAFLNVIAKSKSMCNINNATWYTKTHHLEEILKEQGITHIVDTNLNEACSILAQESSHLTDDDTFYDGSIEQIKTRFGHMFEIRTNTCSLNNVLTYINDHQLDIKDVNEENIQTTCANLELLSKRNNLTPFSWQQAGDIRYNFINIVDTPDKAGLLGYGPMSVDPTTGEIIRATTNIYLSSITNYATKSAILLEHAEKIYQEKDEQESSGNINSLLEHELASMSNKELTTAHNNNLLTAINHNLDSHTADALSFISKDQKNSKEQFFAERNACFSALDEMPYARLSEQTKKMSFLDKVRYLTEHIFEATLKHELGHNFGLRHNFMAGADALNYPPNFWNISSDDHLDRSGFSKEELRSSSIMDYHMNFNGDFSGLGPYDYAALLAGYAQKFEVFDTKEEDFVPHKFINRLNLMHYQDLPTLFAGGNAEYQIEKHMEQVKDNYLRGSKNAHMDIKSLGLKENATNMYKRRVITYEDLKRFKFEDIFGLNQQQITQVPYAFCTDEHANSDHITCQRFIHGSSASEVIEAAIKAYEIRQAIHNIGGNILPKSLGSYLSKTYNQVYRPILRTYQHMYRQAVSSNKIFPATNDLILGVNKGLSFISKVLQTVEPGEYCKNSDGIYELKGDRSCTDPIKIDSSIGRSFASSFDKKLNSPQQKIGFVYDKLLAMLALVDDRATIEHPFNPWQKQTYSIGLYKIFNQPMTTMFSKLFMGAWQDIAPTIKIDNGKAHVVYHNLFSEKKAMLETNQAKIKPGASELLKEYAILFSMSGLSNPLDHKKDFARKSQITRNNFSTDKNAISFKDPYSGFSYQARILDSEQNSPGYLMLKDAKEFAYGKKNSWYEARAKLIDAQNNYQKNNNPFTEEELEEKVIEAQSKFTILEQKLNEKLKTIEKVWSLSNEFAD